MNEEVTAYGKPYSQFCALCNYLQSPLLLIIRLYWGWQFFQTGLGKFSNIPHVTEFFSTLGIPWPLFNAYLVSSVECFGGFFLLIGLFSRLAAFPLAVNMVVAYLTADLVALKNVFHNPDLFFAQTPFLFLYASLIILAFGPGKFSLDYLLQRLSQKSVR